MDVVKAIENSGEITLLFVNQCHILCSPAANAFCSHRRRRSSSQRGENYCVRGARVERIASHIRPWYLATNAVRINDFDSVLMSDVRNRIFSVELYSNKMNDHDSAGVNRIPRLYETTRKVIESASAKKMTGSCMHQERMRAVTSHSAARSICPRVKASAHAHRRTSQRSPMPVPTRQSKRPRTPSHFTAQPDAYDHASKQAPRRSA